MLARIYFLLSALLVCSTLGLSQDNKASEGDSTKRIRRPLLPSEGVIRFLVDVDNGYFEVLVNDSLLIKRYMDTLPEGNYSATVWSPGYTPMPFHFIVEAGKINTQHLTLHHNTAKIDFVNSYREYRNKFHTSVTLPGCLTLANTLISGSFMIAAFDIRKKVVEDVALYQQAALNSEVNDIKLRVEKNNLRYSVYRGIFYTGTGFSLALLGTTIYTALRFKRRNAEPVYLDQSPWHDRFSFQVSPFGCRLQFNIG